MFAQKYTDDRIKVVNSRYGLIGSHSKDGMPVCVRCIAGSLSHLRKVLNLIEEARLPFIDGRGTHPVQRRANHRYFAAEADKKII
jgi:hypothetical protein